MILYVGETGRTLAVRGEEHLRAATPGYKTKVGEHFQQPRHCPDTYLSICVLWQNGDALSRGRFTEMSLEYKLGSFVPCGMNKRS